MARHLHHGHAEECCGGTRHAEQGGCCGRHHPPRPAPDSRPVKIDAIDPARMSIIWSDGCETAHSYRRLRFECRCAHCREEWTGAELVRWEEIPEDVRPLEIAPVGLYALRFRWSDGHDLGFYTYDLLRAVAEN